MPPGLGSACSELSLEMSATQLGRRTLATAAKVPITRLKSGDVGQDEASRIVLAQKELRRLPLTIDDTAGQSPTEIAVKARAAKREHGLGLVMIDHLKSDAAGGRAMPVTAAPGAPSAHPRPCCRSPRTAPARSCC